MAMGVMPASIPIIPAMSSSVLRTVLATILPASVGPIAASGSPTPAVSVAAPTISGPPALALPVTLAVPAATALADATAATVSTLVASVGQGRLSPLPAKLVKKIVALEFAEMADLLPEAWLLDETAMEAKLRRQWGPACSGYNSLQRLSARCPQPIRVKRRS